MNRQPPGQARTLARYAGNQELFVDNRKNCKN